MTTAGTERTRLAGSDADPWKSGSGPCQLGDMPLVDPAFGPLAVSRRNLIISTLSRVLSIHCKC